MKRAFTLIELLVVIAIIAILAAILFPVFAQAKLAAKQSVSLSNQKQIGLAILMYANNYDDVYPRNDGCTLNDSINPVYNIQPPGTDPSPWCNASVPVGQYAFRDNFMEWFKWILPYVKNTAVYEDPVVLKDPYAWTVWGEINGGYALNQSLTGAMDTWPTVQPNGIRNSFTGGTQTGIPSPSQTMLIMNQITASIVGGYAANPSADGKTVTYFPMAMREHWSAIFFQQGGSGFCGEKIGQIDPVAAPYFGLIPLSYADGHSKALPVGQFLANSPSAVQYGLTPVSQDCAIWPYYYGSGTPSWSQAWPMWGLE